MSGAASAAAIALMALIPLVILMLTSFVKVSVVLSLVRNAIGSPEAPSGLVVTGLSLVLTFFVMAPVAIDMVHAAAAPAVVAPAPAQANDLDAAVRSLVPKEYESQVDATSRALVPLRAFVLKHAAERDRETFTGLAQRMGHNIRGDELWVLAPAFVTTELREAFAMAVLIFLPFLVLDLVVGLGLASLGLQTTSPQSIALPLKLLLFVAVDGWRLLLDSLLRGYV